MLAWLRKIRIIIPVKYFFITALAMFPKFWSINMLRAYRIFGQCAVLVSMTSKDETYSGKSFMSVLARLNIFFNMLIRPKILKKNQKNFIRMIFYSQQNDNNNTISGGFLQAISTKVCRHGSWYCQPEKNLMIIQYYHFVRSRISFYINAYINSF